MHPRRTRTPGGTNRTIAPQISHLNRSRVCTIVVIIDKKGAWLLRHTMLISRRTAEQSEDRTWRTSAPKLDPWYMFPIKSSQVVGRPNTPLTCITALCPHETLPRAPRHRVK